MTRVEFAPRGEDAIVVMAKKEGRLAGPLVGRDRENELAFVGCARTRRGIVGLTKGGGGSEGCRVCRIDG